MRTAVLIEMKNEYEKKNKSTFVTREGSKTNEDGKGLGGRENFSSTKRCRSF